MIAIKGLDAELYYVNVSLVTCLFQPHDQPYSRIHLACGKIIETSDSVQDLLKLIAGNMEKP